MRYPRSLALAASALSAAACGQAPATVTSAAPVAGQTFDQFATRHAGRMMAMDTDGDGRISRAEFLAGARAGKGDPAARFARLDTNGDGFVDRSEIDAMMRRRFARQNANQDGTLAPAERAAHAHGAMPDGG